ncbi:hypothetical protein TNCV_4769671 [Trichonephila clavipes]|nr:hypothetical protein TNCV_4769671 [Trichonephila clavipes]
MVDFLVGCSPDASLVGLDLLDSGLLLSSIELVTVIGAFDLLGWIRLDWTGLSSAALGGQGLDSLLVIFLVEGLEGIEESTFLSFPLQFTVAFVFAYEGPDSMKNRSKQHSIFAFLVIVVPCFFP